LNSFNTSNARQLEELRGYFATYDALKKNLFNKPDSELETKELEDRNKVITEMGDVLSRFNASTNNPAASGEFKVMVKELNDLYSKQDYGGFLNKAFNVQSDGTVKLNEAMTATIANLKEIAVLTNESDLAKALEKFEKSMLTFNQQKKLNVKSAYGESFGKGFGLTLDNYKISLGSFAENMDATFTNAFKGMGESFNTLFVQVLDEGFNNVSQIGLDFLKMIRNEMIKTLLVPQIMKGMTSGATSLLGILGFGGTTGSTVTPSIDAGVANSEIIGGMSFMPRAGGGSTLAGQVYMVGEEGPEILKMGSTSGHITSNRDMTNVFNNMSNQAPPSLVVNVENKTGKQVKATQSQPSFDGKKWIRSVMIELADQDTLIRQRYGAR
jgi:hypothetical protein